MTQYDNTNRGVLFGNDRKESDNHPDMKGKLNIDGVDHWVSGWWKVSKNDDEFLSLSLGKPCEPTREQARPVNTKQPIHRGNRPSNAPAKAAPKPAPSGFEDMNDDCPF